MKFDEGSNDNQATALENAPKPVTSAKVTPPRQAPRRPAAFEADDDDAPKGFQRYRMPLILGVLALAGVVGAYLALSKATNAPAAKAEPQIVNIVLPPPSTPPPPPPPPPQEAKQEEKMIAEEKPQEEEAPDPTPQAQTILKGSGGPTGLGVGNKTGIFTNRPTVNSEKMKWSAYAGAMKTQIVAALKNHPKLKKAAFNLDAHVSFDATGRIQRIGGSTGDPALDAAIQEVVTGLQAQIPPEGMPRAVNFRVVARRPN